MSNKLPSSSISGLAYYIRHTLYDEWAQERKKLLEIKWQKNIDAFNCISNGVWKIEEGEKWRSKTFIPETKIKIITAFSMIIDMLLQGGKLPFGIVPSPWDNVTLEELPDEERQFLEDAIDDMTQLIHQQYTDCKADRQLIMNVLAGAIYGETYAKEFIHEVVRKGYRQFSLAEGIPDPEGRFTRFEPYQYTINSPAWGYVSVWNIFRDLESDDLQAGVGVIERRLISPYELNQKKGEPLWINHAIKRAIKEANEPGGSQHGGGDTESLPPGLRNINHRYKTIEDLEFWGRVPKIIVEEFEAELEAKGKGKTFDPSHDYEHDGEEIEIMAVVSDYEVTRYARNEGKRPFHRAVWEVKLDHVEANGVADNMEDTQLVLNGLVRSYEDNTKLNSNTILATKKRYLEPGALKKGLTPGMDIDVAEECDDARKAIQQIKFADVSQGVLQGIPLFERYGDESSQMPRIMQGTVAEKQKPDTLGELHILQQNAGKYLGGVIRNYDEGLIEPITQSFYEYNMMDPNVKKGKGNFIAEALGFTSFQDRVLRVQKILQALQIALMDDQLRMETKFRQMLSEIYKAMDLDVTQVLKTPQEKDEEARKEMEMRAQEEAKVRQIMQEKIAIESQAKEQEHQQDLEKEELKHQHNMKELDKQFIHDAALHVDGVGAV